MKTRPLYPATDELEAISRTINTDDLLDDDDLYDNNWSISADDLFGRFDLLNSDHQAAQDAAA